jgi:hypothetical protein
MVLLDRHQQQRLKLALALQQQVAQKLQAVVSTVARRSRQLP